MTEVLFYHLEQRPLERVLPILLDKTLERGWRAVVQTGSEERSEALSNVLWTWRDEGFLPHGTARDGNPEHQPVWLTDNDESPNGATVRFYVDGAVLGDVSGLERAVYMFDGRDEQAVETARNQWKQITASDHDATYWQQDENGRWHKKA
ncbi:MAG: DNA polymerase III subunit chi [Rhizobiales bacterium]|nr:DNA polymerase III subunit chi [Hyphomicrobiales bacterium]